MPDHIQSSLKGLYHAHEYALLNGANTRSVQLYFGAKQGCHPSPLLFTIYFKLTGIDSVANEVKSALTGTPIFLMIITLRS